jgi:hypothetical protein
MEEKAGKYAHLPVYNKEEEQRKAREREARLAQLFSGENVSFCFGGEKNIDVLAAASVGAFSRLFLYDPRV